MTMNQRLKNNEVKISWHRAIQHDHVIEPKADIEAIAKRGMVCIACKQALCGTRLGWNLVPQRTCSPAKVCKVIVIAVPWDYPMDDKEVQKVEKCHDLKQ